MKIIAAITDMQSFATTLRREGKTIGFVPTMGFLHNGHLSLMRRAKDECDVVVVSIFVNPTEFGPMEDFNKYPRDSEGDRNKCECANADILFLPTQKEMYPEKPVTFVSVEGISEILEGSIRPGHFRGVATVVAKFFNIVKPHKAYFGQKDYQQCMVIKRMVKGLNLDVEVIVLPTIREADGLAMSSRNSYLSAEERRTAAILHRALTAAEALFRSGAREPEILRSRMRAVIQAEQGIAIDYCEAADTETLAPLIDAQSGMVLLLAVRLGKTRLIDNLLLV